MALTSGWWRKVTLATVRADSAAGLLGAILVLPQAIAFATLAGLPPEYGIYTAIVPTIIAAVFGSSWQVVSGPTNANSLALLAAIAPLAVVGSDHYIALALAVTVLVGIIQFTVGFLRLGALADYIAPSVLLGFMSGAAALIALYAVADFLGIPAAERRRPVSAVLALVSGWRDVNTTAVLVGAVTLIVTLAVRLWLKRLPFMLIGLSAGWGVSLFLQNNGLGDRIATLGAVPSVVPTIGIPDVSYGEVITLMSIAPALALVALGQAVSIAKAVATRSGQRIDVNREFIGQGASNMLGGFFGAYLSCGSLNRSVPNYEAGAKTPLAAVFAAVFVLILAGAVAPFIAQIPLAVVAALLLFTAGSLFDGASFVRLWRLSRIEFAIAAVTFGSMLFLSFHVAIGVGVIMALAAYLQRTSRPTLCPVVPDPEAEGRPFKRFEEFAVRPRECPQLKLARMEGSVYYAAVPHVSAQLHDFRMDGPQKNLLVMTKSMNFIDLAGADMWEDERRHRLGKGGGLYFHRPRARVLDVWAKTGFMERLGQEHIFPSKSAAIAHIFGHLDPEICRTCTARIFTECRAVPQENSDNRND